MIHSDERNGAQRLNQEVAKAIAAGRRAGIDAAALVSVLDGKTPLLAHVERASDIVSALSLKKDYPRWTHGCRPARTGPCRLRFL